MIEEFKAILHEMLRNSKGSGCLRIGVAGGSGSGKSTICEMILKDLYPLSGEIIALDRFFKPVEEMPKYYSQYHGEYQPDFNTPDSLKVEEMTAYCQQNFDSNIVIFDGHFALYYPEMRNLMQIKIYIEVCIDEMLKRRTVRNLSLGYGGDRENILAYNRECVLPRHEQFIFPTHRFADIVIANNQSDHAARDEQIAVLCDAIISKKLEK